MHCGCLGLDQFAGRDRDGEHQSDWLVELAERLYRLCQTTPSLSFSLASKTDSKDNRLLGSNSETNVRRTGGQGRLEYDAINDGHGVYVQLFGQGARDNPGIQP
jgi:hypothetical protein